MPLFGDKARKHQAWFRDHSSTISDEGRSPNDDKGQRHGHLLAHGFEHENLYPYLRGKDGALRFFEDRGIKWHRTGRSGDTRGGQGPTRNLASSQIACVNFLLPLREIPGALTAVARAIDDDVEDIVPVCHEGRKSPVEFEWIGLNGPLENGASPTRGANVTSVDAFMVARTNTGRHRAYLMEWKYTEEYLSTKLKFRGKGYRKDEQLKGYSDLYCADSSSFDSSIPMDELLYDPFDQIMRIHLLADRMVAKRELNISDAKVVVVVPAENTTYRSVTHGTKTTAPPLAKRFSRLKTVEDVVKATLKEPDHTFATVSPEMLLDAVERECGNASSIWVAYQRERYGSCE